MSEPKASFYCPWVGKKVEPDCGYDCVGSVCIRADHAATVAKLEEVNKRLRQLADSCYVRKVHVEWPALEFLIERSRTK